MVQGASGWFGRGLFLLCQDAHREATQKANSNQLASVIHRYVNLMPPIVTSTEPHPLQNSLRAQQPIRLSPICLPLYFLIFPNVSGIQLAENPIKWLIFLMFPNDSASFPEDLKSWGP